MTPSLPQILLGQTIALSAPAPPEAGGDYAASRIGLVAMILALAAQEAERGPAACLWENRALRTLFAETAAAYDDALGGKLSKASAEEDGPASWSAMDDANARLRRLLIGLHEAAETRADAGLQRRILDLYVEMAQARRLNLAGGS